MEEHDGDHGHTADPIERGPAGGSPEVAGDRDGHRRAVPTRPRRHAAARLALAVLLVTVVIGAAPGSGPRAAADEPVRCSAGEAPASSVQRVTVDGAVRRYVLALPAAGATRGPGPRPLILAFHGWSSTPERLERQSALSHEGTARGFIVAVPQGSGSPARWSLPGRLRGGDDVTFVRRLLSDLETRGCVDPARVYAVGFSNGAAFAARLSCEAPTMLRAVALVAGAGIGEPCPAARPVPALLAQSIDDPVIPFAGGTALHGRLRVAPFRAAVADWRARDESAGAPVEAAVTSGVGHVWPRTPALDATALVLDAFAR